MCKILWTTEILKLLNITLKYIFIYELIVIYVNILIV